MKIARRIIFSMLAFISLVISVTAGGMWLRRTHLSDRFMWTSARGPQDGQPATMVVWEFNFARGSMRFERSVSLAIPEPEDADRRWWEMSRYNRFRHEVGPPWAFQTLMPMFTNGTSISRRILLDKWDF